MALKDWKQVNSFIWVKKDESEAIAMSQKGFEEKYTFTRSVRMANGHYLMSRRNLFPFLSRDEAIARAKAYMRSH